MHAWRWCYVRDAVYKLSILYYLFCIRYGFSTLVILKSIFFYKTVFYKIKSYNNIVRIYNAILFYYLELPNVAASGLSPTFLNFFSYASLNHF